MIIEMKSQMTGKVNQMDIPLNVKQVNAFFDEPRQGLIQDIFPDLNAEQREFLMTGSTPEEWNDIFGEECAV